MRNARERVFESLSGPLYIFSALWAFVCFFALCLVFFFFFSVVGWSAFGQRIAHGSSRGALMVFKMRQKAREPGRALGTIPSHSGLFFECLPGVAARVAPAGPVCGPSKILSRIEREKTGQPLGDSMANFFPEVVFRLPLYIG